MIDCSFELNDKLMSTFKMGAPAFSGLNHHVNRVISQCAPSQGCITINNWTDYQVVRSLLKKTKTSKIPGMELECYGKVRVW